MPPVPANPSFFRKPAFTGLSDSLTLCGRRCSPLMAGKLHDIGRVPVSPGRAEKTELLLCRLLSGGLSLSAVARIVLLMGSGRPPAVRRGNSEAGGGVPAAHTATGKPHGDHVSGAWRCDISHETGWTDKDEGVGCERERTFLTRRTRVSPCSRPAPSLLRGPGR